MRDRILDLLIKTTLILFFNTIFTIIFAWIRACLS